MNMNVVERFHSGLYSFLPKKNKKQKQKEKKAKNMRFSWTVYYIYRQISLPYQPILNSFAKCI